MLNYPYGKDLRFRDIKFDRIAVIVMDPKNERCGSMARVVNLNKEGEGNVQVAYSDGCTGVFSGWWNGSRDEAEIKPFYRHVNTEEARIWSKKQAGPLDLRAEFMDINGSTNAEFHREYIEIFHERFD